MNINTSIVQRVGQKWRIMSFKSLRYKDVEKYRINNLLAKQRYRDRTGSGKYARRLYSKEEDERILAHDITDRELSKQIKRSVEAIQIRRSRLKKEMQ